MATKPKSYLLKIDKARDDILGMLLMLAITGADSAKFMRTLTRDNLDEEFNVFLKESADKQHELGWCDDPNCIRKTIIK